MYVYVLVPDKTLKTRIPKMLLVLMENINKKRRHAPSDLLHEDGVVVVAAVDEVAEEDVEDVVDVVDEDVAEDREDQQEDLQRAVLLDPDQPMIQLG